MVRLMQSWGNVFLFFVGNMYHFHSGLLLDDGYSRIKAGLADARLAVARARRRKTDAGVECPWDKISARHSGERYCRFKVSRLVV